MVQMSLEQQQCYRSKATPKVNNKRLAGEEEEQHQIFFADIDAKNAAVKKLLFEVENRRHQSSSYETSYEDEDDHSSLGDSTLTASEDGSHGWDEDKELEDPVGDMITDRLNEGSIPYFGYQNYLRQRQQQGNFTVEDATSFDWAHIICVRNFRALRNVIFCAWQFDNNPVDENSSMKFLQEIFLVVLVLAYAVNDVVLRTASWLLMLAFIFVMHTLIDVNELQLGLAELLGSDRVQQITDGMNRCRVYWEGVMKTVHTDFLWGDYLQGRVIAWSEEERLRKFRKKHIALIHMNRERKQNAKTMRRLKRDMKRTRRKGVIENAADTVLANEAKLLLENRKKELDATAKEFNQKPPTYFPASICLREEKGQEETSLNNPSNSDATNGHLEALRFCHTMFFLREREEKVQKGKEARNLKEETISTKDVSITHTTTDSADHIEVVSKDVDMISSLVAEESFDESTVCSDFPSIGEHWNSMSESDDDTISYDDSVNTSEQALPWLAVGAKIGGKLLKSRQLQRVVANPEALQKSIPNEAIKDITDKANEIASDLEMKPENEGETRQDSMELLKRPVHGMWSSPGAKPPVKAKARPEIQGTPTRNKFAVIEMPTSFNDTSFEPPSPPTKLVRNGLFKQPTVDRLTPIEKGVRIIVPMFSPDPNISISAKASSFYQMVSQIRVALIRLQYVVQLTIVSVTVLRF